VAIVIQPTDIVRRTKNSKLIKIFGRKKWLLTLVACLLIIAAGLVVYLLVFANQTKESTLENSNVAPLTIQQKKIEDTRKYSNLRLLNINGNDLDLGDASGQVIKGKLTETTELAKLVFTGGRFSAQETGVKTDLANDMEISLIRIDWATKEIAFLSYKVKQ
jgi:hypothetical protein